jgi:hypothetical protein
MSDHVGVSWVYRLKRDELVNELVKHRIEESGTVDALRKRLVAFVRKNPQLFSNAPADEEDYNEDLDITADEQKGKKEFVYIFKPDQTSTPTTSSAETQVNLQPEPTRQNPQAVYVINQATENTIAKVLDQMRKWNCHFDGKDLYTFLERVDELRTSYGFSEEQVLKGFPELLRGDALLWYRNEARDLQSWAAMEKALKDFFLSPEETRNLNIQIRERLQLPNEPFKKYVTDLSTLMRRHGRIEKVEQLDNLYYNMRPELRLYVSRQSVNSMAELTQSVERIEKTLKAMKTEEKRSTSSGASNSVNVVNNNVPYDRTKSCWKCKQRGHSRADCKNKWRKFCSFCGKDNVLTRECDCHPSVPAGNASRVESRAAAETRPN